MTEREQLDLRRRRLTNGRQAMLQRFDSGCPISQLPITGAVESRPVLDESARTAAPFPDAQCVHSLFESQARRTPEAIASTFGTESLTYQQLDDLANRLARNLHARGVRRGDLVAVHLERSFELLVAILAILKCGGGYVPLPTDYPVARRRFMLEDSRAVLVISLRAMPEGIVPAGCGVLELQDTDGRVDGAGLTATDLPRPEQDPSDVAYVIYTSGSTGEPKGVVVEHRSIARLVFGQSYARFGSDRVFLQLAPVAFDASTFEIWGSLLHGARLVIVPEGPPICRRSVH